MERLTGHLLRAVVLGAAVLAAFVGAGAGRNSASAADAGPPSLSSAAETQLLQHGVALSSAGSSAAQTTGSAAPAVSLVQAEGAAANALGLPTTAIVSASLASLTTPGIGPIGDDSTTVTSPLFSNQLVWAIDFTGVEIPMRGPAGSPTSYTADMIAFVDASTSDFLFATQYDPGN